MITKKNLPIVALILTLLVTAFTLPLSGKRAKAAGITNWDELQNAFNCGGYITLTQDLKSNCSNGFYGALQIPKNSKVILDLNGHTIDRNLDWSDYYGYVIRVCGELTLMDSSPNAGFSNGVYTGGKITGGNNYAYHAGGILVENEGKFTMNGGAITGNKCSLNYGGGVYVSSCASFTMNGGAIYGNSAEFAGGGIYAVSDITINGGIITNNQVKRYGGGIGLERENSIKVSGSAIIINNTNSKTGTADNVNLKFGNKIVVAGRLNSDARIGFLTETKPAFQSMVTITSGLGTNGTTANFVSDDQGFAVGVLDNEIKLMLKW